MKKKLLTIIAVISITLLLGFTIYHVIPPFYVEKIVFTSDKDNDRINDLDDFIEGARLQVQKKPKYLSAYYVGGYPPDDIAVCTDIIWRAFKNAGYDLKGLVDNDIVEHIDSYPRVNGKPDPNIDFRRVRNLVPFFERYATILTTEIQPYDRKNLTQWQGGDIVVFYWPQNEHIAIVSDKRSKNGVPYIIHTYGSTPHENNVLLKNKDYITFHFRYPKMN